MIKSMIYLQYKLHFKFEQFLYTIYSKYSQELVATKYRHRDSWEDLILEDESF